MNLDDHSVPMSCFSPRGERVTPQQGLDWGTMCGTFKMGISNGGKLPLTHSSGPPDKLTATTTVTVILSTSTYEKSLKKEDMQYCSLKNQIFTCSPASSPTDSGMILKKSRNSLFPGNPAYLESKAVPARANAPRQPRSSQFTLRDGALQSVERGEYSIFCDQTSVAADGRVVKVDGRPMGSSDYKWFKYANRPRVVVPSKLGRLLRGKRPLEAMWGGK
ncbi:MAG: hypothetical protein M1829_002055 [Trizodia sp. TS-e1964]|nr:MAG: hypothetical protein M1829_002055 [Trizodia sp. TS-e1964]